MYSRKRTHTITHGEALQHHHCHRAWKMKNPWVHTFWFLNQQCFDFGFATAEREVAYYLLHYQQEASVCVCAVWVGECVYVRHKVNQAYPFDSHSFVFLSSWCGNVFHQVNKAQDWSRIILWHPQTETFLSKDKIPKDYCCFGNTTSFL